MQGQRNVKPSARVLHNLSGYLVILRNSDTSGTPATMEDAVPCMQVSERRIGDVTVLALAGRLVLEEGDLPLRQHVDALIAEGRIDLVLNLHDVTYMDSCGIGALVEEYKSLRRRGGNIKLLCPTERCRRVLAVTHLLSIFESFESEDAAVRSFLATNDVPRSNDPAAS